MQLEKYMNIEHNAREVEKHAHSTNHPALRSRALSQDFVSDSEDSNAINKSTTAEQLRERKPDNLIKTADSDKRAIRLTLFGHPSRARSRAREKNLRNHRDGKYFSMQEVGGFLQMSLSLKKSRCLKS